MAWVPKSSAPEYFSLADAFISLITGDPTWGWLIDWATLVPNTGQSTADFCAAGPAFTEPLVITDFFPSSNPLDPRNIVATSALIYRISLAARDRVFGAYCEQPGTGATGTFGPDICQTFTEVGDAFPAVSPTWLAPPGAVRVRGKLLDHSGTFGMQLRYYSGMTSDAGPFTGLTPLLYGDQSRAAGDYNELAISGGGCYLSIHLDGSATVCVAWDAPAGPVGHVPTAQPQPSGVSSPLRTMDPSLGGIAAELERHEFKLDFLTPLLQAVAGAVLDLGGPIATPVSVPADTVIAVADAVGFIITVSGIPSESSLTFGVPQRIARLGWVNFGTDSAWYPAIPLVTTPMILRPVPPGATRLTITALPPGATATAAALQPLK